LGGPAWEAETELLLLVHALLDKHLLDLSLLDRSHGRELLGRHAREERGDRRRHSSCRRAVWPWERPIRCPGAVLEAGLTRKAAILLVLLVVLLDLEPLLVLGVLRVGDGERLGVDGLLQLLLLLSDLLLNQSSCCLIWVVALRSVRERASPKSWVGLARLLSDPTRWRLSHPRLLLHLLLLLPLLEQLGWVKRLAVWLLEGRV